jgi:hypothetical protein
MMASVLSVLSPSLRRRRRSMDSGLSWGSVCHRRLFPEWMKPTCPPNTNTHSSGKSSSLRTTVDHTVTVLPVVFMASVDDTAKRAAANKNKVFLKLFGFNSDEHLMDDFICANFNRIMIQGAESIHYCVYTFQVECISLKGMYAFSPTPFMITRS